jgi:hypothetical protein
MSYRLFKTVIRIAVVLVCVSGFARAGIIEICKDDSPVGSLSGVATFTIAGQPGTVAVLVGACSPAIVLPDGFATITELAQPGATPLGVSTFPGDRLIRFDAATESAVIVIAPGDISTQTLITFTNAPVTGVPELGTRWLFGLGLTFWALRRKSLNHHASAGAREPRRWTTAPSRWSFETRNLTKGTEPRAIRILSPPRRSHVSAKKGKGRRRERKRPCSFRQKVKRAVSCMVRAFACVSWPKLPLPSVLTNPYKLV